MGLSLPQNRCAPHRLTDVGHVGFEGVEKRNRWDGWHGCETSCMAGTIEKETTMPNSTAASAPSRQRSKSPWPSPRMVVWWLWTNNSILSTIERVRHNGTPALLLCFSSSHSQRCFHNLKRGETLTCGTRQSLTYGIGESLTPFEAVEARLLTLLSWLHRVTDRHPHRLRQRRNLAERYWYQRKGGCPNETLEGK